METQDSTPLPQSHCSSNSDSELCPRGERTTDTGGEHWTFDQFETKILFKNMKLENMKACLQGGGAWFHWCLRPTQPPTLGHQNGEIIHPIMFGHQKSMILTELLLLYISHAFCTFVWFLRGVSITFELFLQMSINFILIMAVK